MIKISTPSLTALSQSKKEKKSNSLGEAHEPSDAVIDRILNFSKALSIKKSKSMGYVENLLNWLALWLKLFSFIPVKLFLSKSIWKKLFFYSQPAQLFLFPAKATVPYALLTARSKRHKILKRLPFRKRQKDLLRNIFSDSCILKFIER